MPEPPYQFTALIYFTFHENNEGFTEKFLFGSDGRRLVPMKMEGVNNLNTVELQIDGETTFYKGDKTYVQCRVLDKSTFQDIIKPGVEFQLWDCRFFAKGVVTKRHESGWSPPST